jgi:hypothetical protein
MMGLKLRDDKSQRVELMDGTDMTQDTPPSFLVHPPPTDYPINLTQRKLFLLQRWKLVLDRSRRSSYEIQYYIP